MLERNPNYWQKGLPYLDRIIVQDLAGSVIGVQRLLTGEIDYVDQLTPADVLPIEKRPGIVLKPITVGRWYFLQWHVNAAAVRQCQAAPGVRACDRPRPPERDHHARPGHDLGWTDAAGAVVVRSDAEVLSARSGAGEGAAGRSRPSETVSSIVLSTPQVSVFQQINQLLQEQLGAVGIKLTLQPVAASEWYARVVSGATNLTPTRWTQRADPDGLLYILFHSKGFANTMKYRNEQVDALLDQARTIYDVARRRQLYAEAQRQIVADLPMVPLLFGAEYAALRASVNGFAVDSRPDPALPRSLEERLRRRTRWALAGLGEQA